LDTTLAPNLVRLYPRTASVVVVPSPICTLSDARKPNLGLGNDRRSARLRRERARAALIRYQAATLTAAAPQNNEAMTETQLISATSVNLRPQSGTVLKVLHPI